MKNSLIKALAAVTLITVGATVQAIPITGSVNFEGGTVHLNGPLTSATAITAFGGSPVVNGNIGVAPTGAYAGTQGSAVTFGSGFTFSPSASYVDAPPLWTFTYLGNVYSFDLQNVASSIGVGPSLNLAGTGVLSITGYANTPGSFTFASTGVGSGPDTFTFGFVAGNQALGGVPDGGSTALLLGGALTGVGLLRKKFALAA
jgi:hypothetical protein